MHALTRRGLARTSLLTLGALTALAACSTADGSDSSAGTAADASEPTGDWPRTVTIGDTKITLEAPPAADRRGLHRDRRPRPRARGA